MERWVLVGLALTGVLTLLALFRTIVYYKANRLQQSLRDTWVIFPGIINLLCGNDPYAYSPYFPVVQQKLLFHQLILLSLMLQIPLYVCYAIAGSQGEEDSSERYFEYLYPVNIMSYWLLFCAFCLVINLWASLVIFNTGSRWILVLRRSLVAICILYALASMYACLDCIFSSSLWSWLESGTYVLFDFCCIGVLTFLSGAFLIVGCMLQGRICRALAPQERGRPRFWATVARLNGVIFVCTISFAMRAALLLASLAAGAPYADTVSPAAAAPPAALSVETWLVFAEWVPHLAPCIALMYLLRNASGPEVSSWGYNQRNSGDAYYANEGATAYGSTVSI